MEENLRASQDQVQRLMQQLAERDVKVGGVAGTCMGALAHLYRGPGGMLGVSAAHLGGPSLCEKRNPHAEAPNVSYSLAGGCHG